MKQIYYIIGKHQATRDLKITVTNSKTDADNLRKKLRADYNDVVILTAQEVCTISKPGWCGVGETIETYSY
jgi:hypothetical protein|tara:strand:- start:2622 stop:2834 length:213 start_codon:yes stop_codon:yes gene_type:complete